MKEEPPVTGKGRIMNGTVRLRPRRKAFTIVEILVVVIIIAVLAAMVGPKFFGQIGKAKRSVAMQKLAEVEKAIDIFRYTYERLPENLYELVDRPPDIPEEKWDTPILKAKDLIDPWEREFIYRKPGDHGPYDLMSLGRDGEPGGEEKDDADVVNWE